MRLFGLKTCDTCRKALKKLAEREVSVDYVDVRKDGIPEEDLIAIYDAFGADMLNKASATWRALSEEERAADPMDLVRAHPTLMKRPMIAAEGTWFRGWGADVQGKLLGEST